MNESRFGFLKKSGAALQALHIYGSAGIVSFGWTLGRLLERDCAIERFGDLAICFIPHPAGNFPVTLRICNSLPFSISFIRAICVICG